MNEFNPEIIKYLEAERYLNEGLIRTFVPDGPNMLTRREWMLKFLEDLGHPEQAYPAIHIAGTSGKGSTAIMIAEILRAAGYKVGLHTTPYLQVATEKLWVDGQYASCEEFIDLVEWIKPICEKWRGPEVPLHGMASFGICLEYFRRKNVDIAVIEAGVGGRDDLTNVLNTKLSVITPLGLDHTITLGNSINAIASHKAGIIRSRTPVVAFRGRGWQIITKEADKYAAPLHEVNHTKVPSPIMPGKFQGINASIAKKSAEVLRTLNYQISDHDIARGITKARLPGRMEVLRKGPKIVIDGAHNHQKLQSLFEEFTDKHTTVIFGILESKINNDVLQLLKGFNHPIILTVPQVYGKVPGNYRRIIDFSHMNDLKIIEGPSKALEEALKLTSADGVILVTGSLYLAGNIRELYYPSDKVLLSRTSWPIIDF